jgi:molybdopterin-guanine dinucleotide biosynthesis protein A
MKTCALAGCVLAGGHSSRMGRDKALLPLAGIPLVERAVSRLRSLTAEVYILGNRPELLRFARLLPDLRQDCGPLGGMEAALSGTSCDWVLTLPVDMPFLPAALLQHWARGVLEQKTARAAFFVVDSVPQPALCLLHREMLPFLSGAAAQGRFKLYPVLEEAAQALADRQGLAVESVLRCTPWNQAEALALFERLRAASGEEGGLELTAAQRLASHRWFENLNTPEQFAEARTHADALGD